MERRASRPAAVAPLEDLLAHLQRVAAELRVAAEAEAGDHKRGLTNKRVSNRRLKMELGYQFKYPTFRQGYTAEITGLEREGKLDIKLEAR